MDYKKWGGFAPYVCVFIVLVSLLWVLIGFDFSGMLFGSDLK